jgi:hypothetical protein
MSICFDPFQSIESLYLERRRLCSTGEDNFDEQLAIAIKRLGNAYRMGKQPTIDSAFDRLAYVIQYAPIGMAAIRKLTLSLSEKHLPNSFSILRDEPLRIVSIGAGPGTDLFGFLMALSIPPKGISFVRMDIGKQWKTYYETIRNDFQRQVNEMSVLISTMEDRFIGIDLDWNYLDEAPARDEISTADVIVLNRVLSIFQDSSIQVNQTIRAIASTAAEDSLLFVLDVSLPNPQFQNTIALTEGICRQEKSNSKWIA